MKGSILSFSDQIFGMLSRSITRATQPQPFVFICHDCLHKGLRQRPRRSIRRSNVPIRNHSHFSSPKVFDFSQNVTPEIVEQAQKGTEDHAISKHHKTPASVTNVSDGENQLPLVRNVLSSGGGTRKRVCSSALCQLGAEMTPFGRIVEEKHTDFQPQDSPSTQTKKSVKKQTPDVNREARSGKQQSSDAQGDRRITRQSRRSNGKAKRSGKPDDFESTVKQSRATEASVPKRRLSDPIHHLIGDPDRVFEDVGRNLSFAQETGEIVKEFTARLKGLLRSEKSSDLKSLSKRKPSRSQEEIPTTRREKASADARPTRFEPYIKTSYAQRDSAKSSSLDGNTENLSSKQDNHSSLPADVVGAEASAESLEWDANLLSTSQSSDLSVTTKEVHDRPIEKSARERKAQKVEGNGSVHETRPSLKTRGRGADMTTSEIKLISANELELVPLDVPQRPVPGLAHDLQRVLFNPGVYQLQDPRSRVYNFDPYLQNIMPVSDFNFEALKDYIVSSEDSVLRKLATEHNSKYFGSSSSMTSVLAHFHFLISQWRPINVTSLSQSFTDPAKAFTIIGKAPAAVFLKYRDGSYAIDADKEFDNTNILMDLGKSLEKFFTLPPEEFEKYRKDHEVGIPDEERSEPESFHYTTLGSFLMRSQLDAHDARLPGTGMFDLKTRAVVSIRMNPSDHTFGQGYQISGRFGNWESYEREYFDMIRSAFLKYSLQVRMGRMDGIFVAFHNVERIFGFQYISLSEMDLALHDQLDTTLGDQEFKLSLQLWNEVLDRITAKLPNQSFRLHFETREGVVPFMYIFAEPVTDEEMERIQSQNQEEIEEYTRKLQDIDESDGPSSQIMTEEHTAEVDSTDESSGILSDPEQSESVSSVESAEDDGVNDAELEESTINEADIEAAERDLDSDLIRDAEPAPETASAPSDISSRDSADDSFHNSISSPTPSDSPGEDVKPISSDSSSASLPNPVIGFSLVIRNIVNDRPVERPTNLSPRDKWTLEYNLTQLKPSVTNSLYQACQNRRKKSRKDSNTPNGDSEDVWLVNGFMRNIGQLVKKGRKRREQELELERQERERYGVKLLYPRSR